MESRRLINISFKRLVLGITAITFTALTVLIAFISSFTASNELANTFHQEGVLLTRNLAKNSVAPLLYGSPASAENVLDTLVDIHQVSQVSIVTHLGKPLLNRKAEGHISHHYPQVTLSEPFQVNETENGWYFSALVTTQKTMANTANDLLEMVDEGIPPEVLGYVNLAFSKDSIYISRRNIFINNFLVSTGVALLLLLAMYLALQNVTRPLEKLSQLMEQGQHGKYHENTDTSGPKEIFEMSRTFNNMIHAIREREQNLSLTLDSIGDAVIATDTSGNITRMNPVAEALTGWHASEATGRSLPEVFRIINAKTRESVADPVEKVLRTGRIVSLANHTVLISKDGSEYQIDDSGAPIIDNDGNLFGVVLVFHDVTERKQIEDELRKHREHLEELVDERTAELHSAQEELLRKQRLAAIGQLTATVSHELRNPLGSIRNSLAVIQRLSCDENPMMKNALKITDRGISRCDNIITELLDFARIRELKLKATNIDAWLGEILDDYEHAPKIQLIRKPGAGVEIHCDRERLLRALLNVLNNACDAVTAEEGLPDSDGRPRLTVTTRIVDDGIEIEIADNGPGIPAEQQEKIFEPLFSTKSFGVGLGMSVVKQVMEQHGGSVQVDSEPGQGARVRLLLPLQQDSCQGTGGSCQGAG